MKLEKKKLYNSDDIQKMMDILGSDKTLREKFFDLLCENPDKRAIERVLESGVGEDFLKYDSEVSELFLRTFEKVYFGREN